MSSIFRDGAQAGTSHEPHDDHRLHNLDEARDVGTVHVVGELLLGELEAPRVARCVLVATPPGVAAFARSDATPRLTSLVASFPVSSFSVAHGNHLH
jgi:hypothetical protein